MVILAIIIEIIIIFMAISGYVATQNYIIGSIVFLVFSIYVFLFIFPKTKALKNRIRLVQNCCTFINSFIINVNVTKSLIQSYEKSLLYVATSDNSTFAEIEHLDILERLVELRDYYNFVPYEVFVNIMTLYVEQGGNILHMSQHLLKEINSIESSLLKTTKNLIRFTVEHIFMWLITFGILLFIRYGLNDYHQYLTQSYLFIACVILFFVYFIICIHIFMKQSLGMFINIKEAHV